MIPEHVFISLTMALSSWAIAGLAFAFNQLRQGLDRGNDDGSGDQPISPPDDPYGIDPQRDPGDWWKHPQKDRP